MICTRIQTRTIRFWHVIKSDRVARTGPNRTDVGDVRLGMFTRVGFYIPETYDAHVQLDGAFVVPAIRRLNKPRESRNRARC